MSRSKRKKHRFFAYSGKECIYRGKVQTCQQSLTGTKNYPSDNNIQTCNVDWEQDCDLIDFLKDKIREIISPQAAASQTPHPAADSSPYSETDTLLPQNGD